MHDDTLQITGHNALKAQAKRLRKALADSGTEVSHSRALELVAQSLGARDWNTLAATQPNTVGGWQVGQAVRGHYLGHAFSGRVHAVSAHAGDRQRLTVDFDTPVDVVRSAHFSSFRRRISALVGSDGRTVEKTSDGQPHLVLVL
ncbi:glyoxalase superfamily protein [Pseudorhodobacter sp.]|uniref:glyoxalase superfamily protein n=1 Tax=Pseudorhodobacter sp. TaxID=1934400 RepID=UPI002648D0C1|nr:glyoxalase superfamily protein [Pseudorhodobacter sp.]MDN5788005.1 hypothetical protein [Pseudorhodobacter sp.]